MAAAKKWHESIEWFWLFWVLFMALLFGGQYLETRSHDGVIKQCVAVKGHPVIEHGELKECK